MTLQELKEKLIDDMFVIKDTFGDGRITSITLGGTEFLNKETVMKALDTIEKAAFQEGVEFQKKIEWNNRMAEATLNPKNEHTCVAGDAVLLSIPPQYTCKICGRVWYEKRNSNE